MLVIAASQVGPPSALLYLVGLLAAGGGLTLLWNIYLRVKRGRSEDADLVSRISAQVVQGAHDLLDEYRVELEVAKRQINAYLDQVTDLNRVLGEANARISRLERDLESNVSDRATLLEQLREARSRREELEGHVAELQRRLGDLERELRSAPRPPSEQRRSGDSSPRPEHGTGPPA